MPNNLARAPGSAAQVGRQQRLQAARPQRGQVGADRVRLARQGFGLVGPAAEQRHPFALQQSQASTPAAGAGSVTSVAPASSADRTPRRSRRPRRTASAGTAGCRRRCSARARPDSHRAQRVAVGVDDALGWPAAAGREHDDQRVAGRDGGGHRVDDSGRRRLRSRAVTACVGRPDRRSAGSCRPQCRQLGAQFVEVAVPAELRRPRSGTAPTATRNCATSSRGRQQRAQRDQHRADPGQRERDPHPVARRWA